MATARKRIGGHKAAYTKLKKKLVETQEIAEKAKELADIRARHMKAAGLPVRSPR